MYLQMHCKTKTKTTFPIAKLQSGCREHLNSYAILNSKLNHKYLCIKQQRSTLLPVVHVVMHIFSNSHLVLKREKTRQKCSASGKKKVCNGRQATFSSILHINFLLQIKNKPNREKIAMITYACPIPILVVLAM